MDFINAALKKWNLTANSTCRRVVSSPWTITSGKSDGPVAYYLARGCGQLAVGSRKPILLQAGDLAFVPLGDPHVLTSDVRTPHSGKLRSQATGRTSTSESADILQCKMQAQLGGGCPFLAALPAVLVLKAGERGENPYLETLLQSVVWESGHQARSASDLVLERLWEVIFILVFRNHLATCEAGTNGWLAGTRDPQLSRVLAAIQEKPNEAWTLKGLSELAAMSRATFIRRFVKIMGQAPMTFLYGHRMGLAASLLKQGERSLANVAEKTGYGSEAAFSTAFRRCYKISPGAYRAKGNN